MSLYSMSTAIARTLVCLLFLCSSALLIAQNNKIRPESQAYTMPEYIEAKEHLDNRRYPEAEVLIVKVLDKLKEVGTTEDYVEILSLHAKSIMHQWRTEEALTIYKKMKKLADQDDLNQLHSDAISAILVIYEFQDSFHLIEELILEGLPLEGLKQSDYSDYYLEYGKIWRRKNKLDSALHYSYLSYDIDKKLNDSISLPRTCEEISNIFLLKNEYDKQLNYLIEGKSYIKKDNSYKHSYFNASIARVMLKIRNIEKAKLYAKESVNIARVNNLISGLSDKLSLLASINEMEGDFDKALNHYEEALYLNKKPKKVRSQISITSGIIACKLNLNQSISQKEIDELLGLKSKTGNQNSKDRIDKLYLRYLLLSDISLSDFNYKSGQLINSFESRNDLYDLRDMHKLRYDFFIKNKSFKKANKSLESFMLYNDMIYAEQQEFRILEIEAKYDKVQDEKQISQLALTNKVQANTLRQQTIFLITAGIGFLVISVLSFFLYKYYRKAKNQNKLISSALKEKDFLLREIHHRVKNNLQVISSLLSLQARQIDNEDIQQAINEGRNRVRSMALIHQNLYQNENLTGVSVEKYLSKLLEELFDTYKVNDDRIQLNVEIEDIELDVDTMVPFGLILNELVSNCLKHAFPEDREGEITIKLRDINNILHLSVIDNGVGFKKEITKSKTFGNRLITAFSNKLHADLEVINDQGTTVNLSIKNYKKAS